MAQSDSWMKEYDEVQRILEEISRNVSERNSAAAAGSGSRGSGNPVINRKLTAVGTRIDSLQSLLSNPSVTKNLSEKDLIKRQEMVQSLQTKKNQIKSNLNSSLDANRNNLLGQDGKVEPKENNKTAGLDNSGIVTLQRQIIRDQDEDLVKLQETVTSTKHIAYAVNEELDLHTRLLDDIEEGASTTHTRLKAVEGRLRNLRLKSGGGCSVMCLVLMVLVIVILVLVVFALIKYL